MACSSWRNLLGHTDFLCSPVSSPKKIITTKLTASYKRHRGQVVSGIGVAWGCHPSSTSPDPAASRQPRAAAGRPGWGQTGASQGWKTGSVVPGIREQCFKQPVSGGFSRRPGNCVMSPVRSARSYQDGAARALVGDIAAGGHNAMSLSSPPGFPPPLSESWEERAACSLPVVSRKRWKCNQK